MTVKEAIALFQYHQRSTLKQRTIRSYECILLKFEALYAERHINSIGSDEIYQFLESITQQSLKSTRRLRYAQLKAFFNFIIDNCCLNMKNPCNSPLLSKTFKMPKRKSRKILDRETVDEMIYNTKGQRDRLFLELQARCGLRIGELLKLKGKDVIDRKLMIRESNSVRTLKWRLCLNRLQAGSMSTLEGSIYQLMRE